MLVFVIMLVAVPIPVEGLVGLVHTVVVVLASIKRTTIKRVEIVDLLLNLALALVRRGGLGGSRSQGVRGRACRRGSRGVCEVVVAQEGGSGGPGGTSVGAGVRGVRGLRLGVVV